MTQLTQTTETSQKEHTTESLISIGYLAMLRDISTYAFQVWYDLELKRQ